VRDYAQEYILAETEEERIAVGMAKINALWRSVHRDDSLPDTGFCALYLKPFITKETLNRALGAINLVRDEVLAKQAHRWSHDQMVANSEIDKIFKLEHL